MTSKLVRDWLGSLGAKTPFIEPGSPWETGYNESSNGTPGEEVLKREIFFTPTEAKVLVEQWRLEYNTVRPHGSLRRSAPAQVEASAPFTPGPERLQI